ncbi:uncharacterized protein LOC107412700 isoform X1 [Ziziphus jujuba]|uniref:Uncharacterized protein LOC107412700 isoform X1 n=2 Tax=Ziziphus jujuba TaxID=326968 RepID=A0A6P3ZR31_ZIZJJ|nr:uncharacterized protein LOC107412700 isoform X1 [Ziziphus jujuba]XP_048331714.2 uncharacterized protein LOC107412700 isoform X1 [Ziziphus jujuba]
MGALAPVTPWIPEDDFLLKNAVEAGASLESLAKGAVQFSRRFTVRELQDRWLSLLYDPVVSAEASACMIEFEHSASMLPSKFDKIANSKENKCVSGKRKVESVRSCYYARRKRICNEPFNSMDLSFLVAPGSSNYVVNGDEHLSANCMPGDPMSNPFGFEGSDMDAIDHAFPQNMIDSGDAAVHNFHLGVQNPVAGGFHIEQNNTHNEIPHIFGENPVAGTGSGIEDLGQSKELPVCDFFKADDLGMKSPSAFDHINSDQPNMCSDFEGNKVFNSPISECGASFSSLDYSSPLPGMSMWRTVSAPALPVDFSLKDKDLCTGGSFELPDDYDAKNTGTSGYDVPLDIEVKTEMDLDDFKGDSNREGYLAELSNSLMDFTNDEEFQCMNFDGKDLGKSYFDGLSSLLLNSPNDVGQDNINNITEAETSIAPDVCITSSSGVCPGELDDIGGSHNVDGQMSCSSETQMESSILASSFQFPELKDGVINCMLNTEDPEIPCNDDIFLPNHLSQTMMPSTAEQKFQEANNTISSSPKDFSGIQKTSDRGPSLMHKERNAPGKSHASSQMLCPNMQEIGSKPSLVNFGVKFEPSKPELPNVISKAVGIASGCPDQIGIENVRTKVSPEMHENGKEIVFTKHLTATDRFIEKQAFDSESFKSYSQTNASGIKEEHDVSVATRDQQSIHTEVASMNNVVPEPALNSPIPEQDGMLIESDDDVPCYSDIEAMILDMDLDPDDQDLYAREEVLRYQNESTKRAIIRLEQGAYSYMQRAIASHGALAILYGRHSKHYIKKPEVLLGRSTEDVTVDIDLGREGRANKISRRQATIKLEKGGSFHLKNLGKSAISINGKEVGPGLSVSLNSNCLIEIRGMPFIFETNPTRIKQYLDSITNIAQIQEHQL